MAETQIVLGSPTDTDFSGPVGKYWDDLQNYPKCPICDGGYGQHKSDSCPHHSIERHGAAEYWSSVCDAVDEREWLLSEDGKDGRFFYT